MRKSKPAARSIQDSDVLIGERVRARRNQIKMSQDQLGDAIGISFQQIQKYEKGTNRISSGRLIQITQALKCSINDLIGGIGDNGAVKSTPFSQFAATREGVAIINAMVKIENPDLRRQVIRLAETLAESA